MAKVSGLIRCGRLVAGQEMPAKRETGKKVEATYGAQRWWEVGGGAGTKEPPQVTLLTPGHLSRGVEDGAGGALPRWALGTSEHGLGASHLKAGKLEPWLSAPDRKSTRLNSSH